MIYSHNKKIIDKLDRNNNNNTKLYCNCKIKNQRPLDNKCNLNNIIYQVNISTKENNTNKKTYIGIIYLNWKFRYHNDLQSYKNPTVKK